MHVIVSPRWKKVTNGVPQGVILGPLIFHIYIIGLPKIIDNDAKVLLFADDTIWYLTLIKRDFKQH